MNFKGWDRVIIGQDNGEPLEGIAPVIISASRATDIPAFYSLDFIESLKKGYIRWVNPFNGKKIYVSFSKTRVVVFWTKNPAPLIPLLPELDKYGVHYLVHFTLNDYEKDGFEPNLPPLLERVKTFKLLSQLIGRERVLWRFDPMILTPTIDTTSLLEKIERVGELINQSTTRLTVSFLSMYPKVNKNFAHWGITVTKPDALMVQAIGEGLNALSLRWGVPIVTCAESLDFNRYGVRPGCCIDPLEILKLFKADGELTAFFNRYRRNDLLDAEHLNLKRLLKDPGQRDLCGCMVSKDIGRYNTCAHNCIYCYANSSDGGKREKTLFSEKQYP